MANQPGVSLQYLQFLLNICDGVGRPNEHYTEEELYAHDCLVLLYPAKSDQKLQVQLLVSGDVEVHATEDHNCIGRFTMSEFLQVCPKDKFSTEIADWVAIAQMRMADNEEYERQLRNSKERRRWWAKQRPYCSILRDDENLSNILGMQIKSTGKGCMITIDLQEDGVYWTVSANDFTNLKNRGESVSAALAWLHNRNPLFRLEGSC